MSFAIYYSIYWRKYQSDSHLSLYCIDSQPIWLDRFFSSVNFFFLFINKWYLNLQSQVMTLASKVWVQCSSVSVYFRFRVWNWWSGGCSVWRTTRVNLATPLWECWRLSWAAMAIWRSRARWGEWHFESDTHALNA